MNEQFNDPNLGVSIIAIHWADQEAHRCGPSSSAGASTHPIQIRRQTLLSARDGEIRPGDLRRPKGKDVIPAPGTRCSGSSFGRKRIVRV